MAICSKCASENINDRGVCRPCHAANVRAWVSRNREKKAAADRAYRLANLETVRAKSKERGEKNRARNRLRSKRWYEANKERSSASVNEARLKRMAIDLDGFRKINADAARLRRGRDPKIRFNGKMSRLVAKTLKRRRTSKQGRTWPSLVGYSIAELEARLISTLPEGYVWEDYLSGALQIDHIVPVAAHNFHTAEDIDFKRCWALSNLRLLTKEANYEKRAKLSAPFQPSLLLEVPRGAAV